jgi:WD40 repeat protein
MEVVSSTVDVNEDIPGGVRFSPDGLCVLTSVRDELRLYNTSLVGSSWNAALTCKGGDVVQSFDWYPHMDSQNPSTCCFVGTSREQPVHLYDAYTGKVRATYSPYSSERDEPISPLIGIFDPSGSRLICGGFSRDRFIQIFDISRPGKDSLCCYKLGKTRRSQDGQKGLVSSISCATSSSNILAVGTYSPGSIYLYDTRVSGDNEVSVVLHGGISVVGHGKRVKRFASTDDDEDIFSHARSRWFQKRAQTGITQLHFCHDDHTLLSASRKSDAVLLWDIRMMTCPNDAIRPISGVKSYAVNHNTNQRIGFQVHEDRLYIGDRDKCVKVYDVASSDLLETIAIPDVVNGVSIHSDFMAVSLGERTFEDEKMVCQGRIELWRRRRQPHCSTALQS